MNIVRHSLLSGMKLITPSIVSAFLFAAFAQGQVLINFDSAAKYNDNFRETFNGNLISYDNAVPSVKYAQSGGNVAAVTMYDTTPADGSSTINLYDNASIRLNFQMSGSMDSIAILARVNGSGYGYMGIVNLATTANNNVLRIFDGATTTGAAGTSVAALTSTSGNLLTIGTYYSLEFSTVNSGSNVQLTLSLFALNDFGGVPIYTVNYLDTTTPYSSAGQAGVRFGKASPDYYSATNWTTFAIVPEPSVAILACSGIGFFFLLRLPQRRRSGKVSL